MILIVKCGGPAEQGKPKPGNRGKRDSQLILMNFFSRVTYNDRMTPLDYDLFQKIKYITGVTPDLFEVVLMVRKKKLKRKKRVIDGQNRIVVADSFFFGYQMLGGC
jgi:hypothetical protein